MKTQVLKFDNEKRIAYGVVYAPDVPDAHGDFMEAGEIEAMAHRFLAEGRVTSIDTEHDLTDNGSVVVESFIARKGDPDFPEGAWVVGVHIPDAGLWEQVKKGEIGGLSMYGLVMMEDATLEIELPDDGLLWGETFDHEGHTHKYVIKFDEEGNFLGGMTDEVDGHSHVITRGTVTDRAGDVQHRHRYNFLENLK